MLKIFVLTFIFMSDVYADNICKKHPIYCQIISNSKTIKRREDNLLEENPNMYFENNQQELKQFYDELLTKILLPDDTISDSLIVESKGQSQLLFSINISEIGNAINLFDFSQFFTNIKLFLQIPIQYRHYNFGMEEIFHLL